MKWSKIGRAAAPLPSKGRGWGGVCNFLAANYIQTPPRPSGTPPLEGRGAAARPISLHFIGMLLFQVGSLIKFRIS